MSGAACGWNWRRSERKAGCGVLEINPCPPLPLPLPGYRPATGWVEHSSGVVCDLRVQGESKPIRATPTHPIWSVDEDAWVQVQELRQGGRLLASDGMTPVVEMIALREKGETVYNIEVEGGHCYRVGDQGLLVHNASDPTCNQMTVPCYDLFTGCDLFGSSFSAPGGKEYLPLDQSRATGVRARLCKANIGGGSPTSSNEEDPPVKGYLTGWKGAIVRAHLLPARLGGPGSGPGAIRNLTIVCRRTNRRLESQAESVVYAWVQAGLIVDYEVEVKYKGDSPYPEAFRIRAKAVDPESFKTAGRYCQDLNLWDGGRWLYTGTTDIYDCPGAQPRP